MNAAKAAALLLDARRSGLRIDRLPADCRPDDYEQAYAIQAEIIRTGPALAGWKMGRFAPNEGPVCAPFFRNDLFPSGARLVGSRYAPWMLEVEIGFRVVSSPGVTGNYFGRDAIEVVPIIEVLSGRYTTFDVPSHAELLADSNANGAFIVGAPLSARLLEKLDSFEMEIACDDREPIIVECATLPIHQLLDDLVGILNRRGIELRPGDLIATGSIVAPVPAVRRLKAVSALIGSVEIHII